MNEVIVITGASKGIGRATAKQFAESGYKCILNSRTEEDLTVLAKELPGKHSVVAGDIGDEETAERIRVAVEEAGRVDILVNNAGFGDFGEIQDYDVKNFRAQLNTNVIGVFLPTKHLLPVFKEQNTGCIITIGSLAGKNHFAGGSAYASTKWAVRGFMGCLKKELRDTKVKTGTILPGSVDTAFFADLPMGPTPDRHLDAEDVAETIWFLAHQPKHADIDEITLRPAKRQ